MEEEQKKECKHCYNFKRYYIKRAYKFTATEIGQCYYKNEIVNKDDSCDCWEKRINYRDISNKRVCRTVLASLLTEIAAIRETLENEN
ncbi:MAG: hypothetical protein J1F36_05135 [Clostridiales bacterium]|nr:hypothetical protein [Clostridiales bacterium]